jgi:hypothetical protein
MVRLALSIKNGVFERDSHLLYVVETKNVM